MKKTSKKSGSEKGFEEFILGGSTRVLNVGLASFHSALVAQGARVVHLDWRPPAGGNREKIKLLSKVRSLKLKN